ADIYGKDFIMLALERFLFVFSITVPFDIRDIESDSSKGVISIAVSLGEKRSKILAILLLLIFSVLTVIHYGKTGYFYPLLISAASAIFLAYKTSPEQPENFYLFWLDGTMILQFLLVWMFT